MPFSGPGDRRPGTAPKRPRRVVNPFRWVAVCIWPPPLPRLEIDRVYPSSRWYLPMAGMNGSA